MVKWIAHIHQYRHCVRVPSFRIVRIQIALAIHIVLDMYVLAHKSGVNSIQQAHPQPIVRVQIARMILRNIVAIPIAGSR